MINQFDALASSNSKVSNITVFLLLAFTATVVFLVSHRGNSGEPISSSYGAQTSLRNTEVPASSSSSSSSSPSSSSSSSSSSLDEYGSCICGDDYNNAITSIDSLISRISYDWNVSHYPEFLAFMHIPTHSWEIQKQKFIKVILEANANKKNKKKNINEQQKSPYIVGFGGSSVAAGHDNYFHQAYPQKFFDAVNPAFVALGLDLEVRNHAMGNNPCYPYDACTETHLGDDVDVVAWEQSMNCGRDPKPLEHMVRDAMMMKKRPTVWFVLSGTPFWQSSDCDPGKFNVSAKVMTAREDELLKKSLKEVVNTANHMSTMYFLESNSKKLYNEYPSVGSIGQNIMALQNYKCQGPYNASFPKKPASLPGGANWHPGVLGHQLKGDSLAYTFLHILKEALETLQQGRCVANSPSCTIDSASSSSIRVDNSNKEAYSRTMEFLNKNQYNVRVPETAVACDPLVCRSDSIAKCYTQFLPRVQRGIDDIIVGLPPIALARNQSSVLDMCKEILKNDSSKSCNNNNKPLVHDSKYDNKWTKEGSFYDVMVLEKLAPLHLGYLDRKILYYSHGVNSVLSFKVTIETTNSKLWLCELHGGLRKFPSVVGHLDKAEVFVDRNVNTNLITQQGQSYLAPRQSILSLHNAGDDCFETNEALGKGTHVVSIKQKDDSQILTLAYILHW